ncbi:hypothetical protein ACHAW6_004132, partial [Cyclotella cf. meneghiniana]
MNLWDRLLPQTEITMNLLQQSNCTPMVLVYAHPAGPFDYNKMLLAPMGCEVQVHGKTGKCVHGLTTSLIVGICSCHPSINECKTQECLTDTIQVQHKNITNPSLSPHDKLMNAIANCKAALHGTTAHNSNQQLQDLNTLVQNAEVHVRQRYHTPSTGASTAISSTQNHNHTSSKGAGRGGMPDVEPLTNTCKTAQMQ